MKRASNPGNALREYRAKRTFSSTPEPSGATKSRSAPSRQAAPMFCVQKHLASQLHYDFRLEHNGVLLSWAVPKGPSLNPADKRLAVRVEDHPLDYGDFEGVIPEGYGAGIVMLWDRGTWQPDEGFENVDQALADGELKFHLEGVKLKGGWVLVRTGGRPGGNAGPGSRSWLLIKHRDSWAGAVDVLEQAPDSVKSFADLAGILAADNPKIWESHRPVSGGTTGKMLQDVIAEAAQRTLRRQSKKPRAGAAKAKPKRSAASTAGNDVVARKSPASKTYIGRAR